MLILGDFTGSMLAMLVLGIESSCDETAAAMVRNGREILSSVIASQTAIHRRFGGVVPELASREHLDKIVPIVEAALSQARIEAQAIDGIAVTVGPGLVGSLLVGVSYAKAIAFALSKPIVGVNHIEGHIYSVAFDNPPVKHSIKWRNFLASVTQEDRLSRDSLNKATLTRSSFHCRAWEMAHPISVSVD